MIPYDSIERVPEKGTRFVCAAKGCHSERPKGVEESTHFFAVYGRFGAKILRLAFDYGVIAAGNHIDPNSLRYAPRNDISF